MSPRFKNLLLLAFSVVVLAITVWVAGQTQRETIVTSFRETEAVDGMLTAMLDRETSLRGFLQTGREEFLEPYQRGDRAFRATLADARRHVAADARAENALLDRVETLVARWSRDADRAVARVRERGVERVPVRDIVERKAMMDAFRATTGRLHARFERQRHAALDRSTSLSVLLIVGLSLLFGLVGWLTIGRPARAQERRDRADRQRRERHMAFARTLQLMDSEAETHGLVKQQLERAIRGSEVAVLQRNNSANRLEVTTHLADDHRLRAPVEESEPRDCLAVRLGRSHTTASDAELLDCGLCGKLGTELATCTPLLVSGEVIGSVLVGHEAPLAESEREFVEETVTQAAPVIANMRNLAIAELRAATDSLTGLANRRATQDALRRMIAQASRAEDSLAIVALDLDHFKSINDRFGHDRGDDVLAAAAQALTGCLRASDVVGRQGGEEFVALLPGTGLDGALVAADNLRRAIARLRVPGVDVPVTASFGVAVFPEDASEPDLLLRQADRALYAAKGAGRNRVETAAGSLDHSETPA